MNKIIPISVISEAVFSIVEFLLTLRVIFKLLAANPQAPLVSWVYETTNPVLFPFTGIFQNQVIKQQFVLELSTLFAILVYAFIGYLVSEIVALFEYRLNNTEKNKKSVLPS